MIAPRLVLLAALAAPFPAAAQSTPGAKAPPDACFDIVNLQGSRAVDAHTVLFRASVSDVYELKFAAACPALTWPSPQLLITPFGGQTFVCHALDLQVGVRETSPGSIPVPCIPTGLRKLTRAEAAALPAKDRP